MNIAQQNQNRFYKVFPFSVSQRAREVITAPSSPVLSGAVARMEGKASLGETIDIVDHQGNG